VDGVWGLKSEGVGLIVRAVSFQDYQSVWSQSTNVTDRQTDRQTGFRCISFIIIIARSLAMVDLKLTTKDMVW